MMTKDVELVQKLVDRTNHMHDGLTTAKECVSYMLRDIILYIEVNRLHDEISATTDLQQMAVTIQSSDE